MIENKRFIYAKSEGGTGYAIYDTTKNYTFPNLPREYEATVFCRILNELNEKNEGLNHHISELQGQNEILNKQNAMLKNTIARNEAYIERMQHKGEWKK